MDKVIIVLGILLAFGGVMMIFDARSLSQKFFSFGNQNESTSGLKILGFLLAIIGALMLFFNQ